MSGAPDYERAYSPAFREMLREATRPKRGTLDRVTIRRTADGLGIHNPTRRSIPVILFLLFWLCGWAAGAGFALTEIVGGTPWPIMIFLMVWLSIWTVGGVVAMLTVAWQLAGIERLFIISGVMVVERGFGPFRRRQIHPLADVTNLRVKIASNPQASGLVQVGSVTFDVAGKTYDFGIGLDSVETAAVIDAIRAELKRPDAGEADVAFGRG